MVTLLSTCRSEGARGAFFFLANAPLFLSFLYPPKHQLPRICMRWAGERGRGEASSS